MPYKNHAGAWYDCRMKRLKDKFIAAATIVIALSITTVLVITDHTPSSEPVYVGHTARLIKPDQTTIFQIDQSVLAIPPKLPIGVQANIQLTATTTTAAKGIVSYGSSKYSPQLFMATKNGTKWVVIAHTTTKSLPLPSINTARKYHLPQGWYEKS